MSEALSPRELAAVFISRQVRNGEYVSLGTNLPVPTAGVLLAHLTHAPDLKINVMNYFTNLSNIERFEDLNQVATPRAGRWAEAFMSLEEMVDSVARMDLCFAGGMQVDRYGATNLIGVGEGPGGWKVRGPGSVGTATVMCNVRRYIIWAGEHSPRVLVERCQYRSTAGWADGGRDARRRLGIPGGGPEWVVTPRAAFDFHPETRVMRLRYVFPPWSVEEVLRDMGFRPDVHPDVGTVTPPSEEEVRVLRTRVDPAGLLRQP